MTTTTPTKSEHADDPGRDAGGGQQRADAQHHERPDEQLPRIADEEVVEEGEEPADVPHRSAPRAGSPVVPEAAVCARLVASTRRASWIASSPTAA